MVQKTGGQSQVESKQSLKEWYLMRLTDQEKVEQSRERSSTLSYTLLL